MEHNSLGPLGPVSRICLGGGGLGGVWGKVTLDEAVATLRYAVDRGVTLLDTSPRYGSFEEVMARAFEGQLEPDILVTTKIWLDPDSNIDVYEASKTLLHSSARAMRLSHIDVLFLHNALIRNDAEREGRSPGPVLFDRYQEEVVPAMTRLQAEGHIRFWGITAGSGSKVLLDALARHPLPAVAQVPTNVLDSGGDMSPLQPETSHSHVAEIASNADVGVMGIRVVQAGALTPAIDRSVADSDPVARDHRRAAPFFELCRKLGEEPVEMAYRYALGIPGVATLVAGAKNRMEFDVALTAETKGMHSAEEMRLVDRALKGAA